jgi:calreticulin
MKAALLAFALFGLLAFASSTVHFQEDFDDSWESRWVYSTHDDASGNAGKFAHTAGKYFNDAEKDKGIQTSQDARFYKLSATFPKFTNKDKPLVIQYSVKHEQSQDCGGAYIKVGPGPLDQEKFEGETKYNVMFGPDVCGSTKRVHFIVNYKGQNHLIKREVRPETDIYTHLYTAVIFPNQTYEFALTTRSSSLARSSRIGTFLPPSRSPTPPSASPPIGSTRSTLMTPRPRSPPIGTTPPSRSPTPRPRSPRTGMTSSTVSGRPR